jgi:hypothetical protein|nr:MAG TPA: hypothetical protein [Caudoviricetes sp.]
MATIDNRTDEEINMIAWLSGEEDKEIEEVI